MNDTLQIITDSTVEPPNQVLRFQWKHRDLWRTVEAHIPPEAFEEPGAMAAFLLRFAERITEFEKIVKKPVILTAP